MALNNRVDIAFGEDIVFPVIMSRSMRRMCNPAVFILHGGRDYDYSVRREILRKMEKFIL